MAQVQIIQPYQPQSDALEKVAAYCRMSTDSKDQLNSYHTQIGYYTNFIAQHPGWELVDIYADEGITGTSLEKRDEFKRMLQDCRAGKISRILVKSVSRFARNTLELIETTRELKDLGVVVVFEEQGIDTAQMLGEMQLTLLAMAAQEESTSIPKNMRWSIQKRMESGAYKGSSAPFGYRLENGELILVPEEAKIVGEIFALYLSGIGQYEITHLLNEKNIPFHDGKKWSCSAVKYILSNENYTGKLLLQRDFQMAHQKKESANTNRQSVDEDVKLFKSLVHCHHCGGIMVRRMDSRMGHPVTWKCPPCEYFLPLPDEKFKQRVFLLQKKLVEKSLLAEKEEETIPVASMEARRLTNEIFRKLDSGVFSEEELVNLALQCAAENYQTISSARHITDRLTAALLHAGPLSAFDRELFQRTVSEIHLTRKGEILLKLQNGVFVGEGEAP